MGGRWWEGLSFGVISREGGRDGKEKGNKQSESVSAWRTLVLGDSSSKRRRVAKMVRAKANIFRWSRRAALSYARRGKNICVFANSILMSASLAFRRRQQRLTSNHR